jgi:ketosteroid isomerase-like protein
MSAENVELIRHYFETWNEGGGDATASFRHPEIEILDPPNFPDADRYVGEDVVRERVEGYLEAGWDGIFRELEFFDAGDEVLVAMRVIGKSPIGGVPLDVRATQLFLVEDGRIRRIRQFLSREEGMKAAGFA